MWAEVCEAAGQEEEAWTHHQRAMALADARGGHSDFQEDLCDERRRAQRLLRAGRVQEAEAALTPRELLMEYERRMEGGGLMIAGTDHFIKNLRLLAEIWERQGRAPEAACLRADADESEAIIQANKQGMKEALLAELRAELGNGAGAGAADSGGGGSAGGAAKKAKRKKLTRKQQKRKAAQRRKAEEATAAAAGRGVAEVEEVTEAAAQLAVEERPAAAAEEEEEQEPEPEECAICLGDLPAPGEAGGVLLACSHVFHAECLGRWKDKCLDKGLRVTCAMCREAVVVVTPAAT